jgi:hypothetical protein
LTGDALSASPVFFSGLYRVKDARFSGLIPAAILPVDET